MPARSSAHLLRRGVVDLAGDVGELALAVREPGVELRLVDLHDRRQLRRVPHRVLDDRGSALIVVCGTDTARTLPVRSKMLPRSAGTSRCARADRARAMRGASGRGPAGRRAACRSRRTRHVTSTSEHTQADRREQRHRLALGTGPGLLCGRRGACTGAVPGTAAEMAARRRGPGPNRAPRCATRCRREFGGRGSAWRVLGVVRRSQRQCGHRSHDVARCRHGCWSPRLRFAFVQSLSVSGGPRRRRPSASARWARTGTSWAPRAGRDRGARPRRSHARATRAVRW